MECLHALLFRGMRSLGAVNMFWKHYYAICETQTQGNTCCTRIAVFYGQPEFKDFSLLNAIKFAEACLLNRLSLSGAQQHVTEGKVCWYCRRIAARLHDMITTKNLACAAATHLPHLRKCLVSSNACKRLRMHLFQLICVHYGVFCVPSTTYDLCQTFAGLQSSTYHARAGLKSPLSPRNTRLLPTWIWML